MTVSLNSKAERIVFILQIRDRQIFRLQEEQRSGTAVAAFELKKVIFILCGISRELKAPMKIVWINQTRVLRFFTLLDDELFVRRYAETVVRRSFGTENAMKLGKPIPKGK